VKRTKYQEETRATLGIRRENKGQGEWRPRKEYGRGRTAGGMGSKKGEIKAKGEELRSRKVTFVFYSFKGTASRYFIEKVFS
jgi:hypothetical protein